VKRHFLPAAPDETVIAIGFYSAEGPPSVETAYVDRHRVIGWRIEDGGGDDVVAYPVCIDAQLDHDVDVLLFHVMPDGRLMLTGDVIVESEEEAKQLAAGRMLAAVERRRSKPAA
jgi:hypothetical protein